MTTRNLIITVPIHETDLDLSAALAKRAADSAAFQFWTLANNQQSDLSAITPAPVLSMSGTVVATWELQGPAPENFTPKMPTYLETIENPVEKAWGERFTTRDGITMEWTHDMADGGASGYAQVERPTPEQIALDVLGSSDDTAEYRSVLEAVKLARA